MRDCDLQKITACNAFRTVSLFILQWPFNLAACCFVSGNGNQLLLYALAGSGTIVLMSKERILMNVDTARTLIRTGFADGKAARAPGKQTFRCYAHAYKRE
jgi:hypothetical protein